MSEYDPEKVRVRDGWLVVLMEERQELLASGIFLPPSETSEEKLHENAGTVVSVGPGTKNEAIGIKKGDRVCLRGYLKHANAVPTGKTWPSGQPCEYFIMSSDDVLAVVPSDVSVGVFSRPSQSAVESVDDEGNVRMRR